MLDPSSFSFKLSLCYNSVLILGLILHKSKRDSISGEVADVKIN